jgi:hypothetical protein
MEDQMKRLIIAAGLLLTLALPAGVAAAAPAWNLTGVYTINFTCTSGCDSTYLHSMTITASDNTTGAITGTGAVQGFPGYEWSVTGTVSGSDVTLAIAWTGPAGMEIYNPMTLTGSIDSVGALSGTAVDAQARTFTWATTEGNATKIEIVEGATATTAATIPPTSTANGPATTSGEFMVLLISLAFGVIGVSAAARQRRSLRG